MISLPLVIHDCAVAVRDTDGALPLMAEDDFRAFYERTARPLWAYLSRLTRDPGQVDDLLQEAYYRFYRAGARHESEAHRRNSLFQIATNLARDAARHAGRRQDVPLADDSGRDAAPRGAEPVPERRAIVRTDLARALRRLEPPEREMLWLAYAQGASHQEIADVLGLRAPSIRTLLFRARKKLAAILGGGRAEGKPEEAPR